MSYHLTGEGVTLLLCWPPAFLGMAMKQIWVQGDAWQGPSSALMLPHIHPEQGLPAEEGQSHVLGTAAGTGKTHMVPSLSPRDFSGICHLEPDVPPGDVLSSSNQSYASGSDQPSVCLFSL